MKNSFNSKLFSALLVSVLTIKSGYGQTCQQSLPSQYNPIDDPSTTTSNHSTFYLYPDFFKSTHCLGPIPTIQYQFCYLYVRTSGSPDVAFTVLILRDEGSVYSILHAYSESENKRECSTDMTPCCKTVSFAVTTLNIQRELALGFVIPGVIGGNALYASNAATSPGFAVSSTTVPNTGIGSTIKKTMFSGGPKQIHNRRFSISFMTESSPLPTQNATSPTETSIHASSDSDSVGRAIGGVIGSLLMVIAVVILILALVLMKKKCKKAEASKAQCNLNHLQPKVEKSEGREQRKTAQHYQQQTIEMKSNDAYIIPQGLQIPTVENVAYNPIQSNSFNQPQLNSQHEYEYVSS